MGSFDVSCAVSGLHIGYGDRCLAFQLNGEITSPIHIENLIHLVARHHSKEEEFLPPSRQKYKNMLKAQYPPDLSSSFYCVVPFFAYGTYADYGEIKADEKSSRETYSEGLDTFYIYEKVVE